MLSCVTFQKKSLPDFLYTLHQLQVAPVKNLFLFRVVLVRRLAGKVIRDFFLNPDHKFGIFPEAFIIRKVVNKLAVEEEGLLIAVGMRIQTKF